MFKFKLSVMCLLGPVFLAACATSTKEARQPAQATEIENETQIGQASVSATKKTIIQGRPTVRLANKLAQMKALPTQDPDVVLCLKHALDGDMDGICVDDTFKISLAVEKVSCSSMSDTKPLYTCNVTLAGLPKPVSISGTDAQELNELLVGCGVERDGQLGIEKVLATDLVFRFDLKAYSQGKSAGAVLEYYDGSFLK